MNNNELMKDLYKILRLSGWLDKATKYFREHPERFTDCSNYAGKIASINMSVSYQPWSLSAVADVKPNVFISMSTISTDEHKIIDEREFNVYETKHIKSRTWIDDKLVIDDTKVIDAKVNNELCTLIV